ncbi:3TM-type holin [Thalassospira povalilytica]|uniref:3TM-type holin n=1 Tax=Thalassospira povalilytica TaxID=732237 RepID=UPI003AA820C8
MVIPFIPALIGLAPTLIDLFTKDDSTAEKVLNTAVAVGKSLTGKDDPDDIAQALQADPALLMQFQIEAGNQAVEMYREDTKRLEAINQTMQVESKSEDWYVRRMRPTFGYIMAITWGLQMGAIAWTIINTPEYAAEVIAAMLGLSTIWSVGLAVLGVYVYRRSGEKQSGVGPSPAGVNALSRMAGGIGKMFGKPAP